MATSPNYAWAEPDNSSLVKNGASDIRTLGDAIDTSVWNVGFGQAGKNKFINGDFSVNQRQFTSSTASGVYNFDRYDQSCSGGTVTFSAQTFTLGSAPVAGYEGKNFLRFISSGQVGTSDFAGFGQRIESVRTFAGQTVTLSFWAKAATGTPSIAPVLQQVFGTGGSPSATVQTNGTPIAITTSWVRYSQTFNVPSISGKTLGTNNNDLIRFNLWGSLGSALTTFPAIGLQNNTFDFWGLQVEYGAKMTPFQLAGGGDPQSELAMCQRYYYRVGGAAAYETFAFGVSSNTTNGYFALPYKSTLRTLPSAVEYASIELTDPGTGSFAVTSMVIDNSGTNQMSLNATTAGILIAKRPYFLRAAGTTNGYIAFSAEL